MSTHEPSIQEDEVARRIVDAAITVHRSLGPGLLESVYEQCLAYELEENGLSVHRQVPMPVRYRNLRFDMGFRLDLVVQNLVIVELKAVEQLVPLHDARLLTYLKLAERRLGLLMNFNVPPLKHGIKRLVRSVSL
ncbi:MAG: GxxExxY protein [Planctomycetota bacterium]|nr:GxxExxY protein [Planctomycetaceae bacterium]MDQ3333191.1 GxxExxY protein [Planctomycetota bacterium]